MSARTQIYSAAFGIAGTAFGLGMQLAVTIISGYGWWKVGMAAFSVLCLAFLLWRVVRQILPK